MIFQIHSSRCKSKNQKPTKTLSALFKKMVKNYTLIKIFNPEHWKATTELKKQFITNIYKKTSHNKGCEHKCYTTINI